MTVTGAGLPLKKAPMPVNGAKEFVRMRREQMAQAQMRVELVRNESGTQDPVTDEVNESCPLLY
jgi:hypothetical protein